MGLSCFLGAAPIRRDTAEKTVFGIFVETIMSASGALSSSSLSTTWSDSMDDDEPLLTTTREFPFTPPPLYNQPPRHFIPSSYPHLEPRRANLDAFGQPVVGHPPETILSAYPFTPPTQHITPPVNVPPMIFGPRFSTACDGAVIRDDNMVATYIETRLRMMGKHRGDKDYEATVQKAVLDLISTARLTAEVFVKLRS